MESNQIYIFDTTLRDGQQSPGAGMSFADNLQYADLADLLRVDILEARNLTRVDVSGKNLELSFQ